MQLYLFDSLTKTDATFRNFSPQSKKNYAFENLVKYLFLDLTSK